MLTATLGGLIKDYRIKKRLSQLEVSLRIGWKDTSRLSKIEQGRVGKPTRETIDKVIRALDLTNQEKGEFLLVGGYLPTKEEIKVVIKKVKHRIDAWSYPAYLMDFSWRWLTANQLTFKVIKMPLGQKKMVEKVKPNFLEFPFLPPEQLRVTITKGEDKEHLKSFKIAQIAAFKTENSRYLNEGWCKKLIRSLMKYEEFRKLWPKIGQDDYHKKLLDYEYKRFSGVYDGKKQVLDFHLLTAKLIEDPRFQIVLCYPANNQAASFCRCCHLSSKKL